MTTPIPAATAKPGARFSDPVGGAWVLLPPPSPEPWFHSYANHLGRAEFRWRSQEEAEKAGLVPLVAETEVAQARHECGEEWAKEYAAARAAESEVANLRDHLGDLADEPFLREQIAMAWKQVAIYKDACSHWYEKNGELSDLAFQRTLSIDLGGDWGVWGVNTLVEALTELGVEPGMDLGDIVKMVAEREAAPLVAAVSAPVPLDPSNPDDLRRVAALVWASDIAPLEAVNYICNALRMKANRLDAERAEQARDEADEKLARELAETMASPNLWKVMTDEAQQKWIDLALAGLRAGRAERARASAEDAS